MAVTFLGLTIGDDGTGWRWPGYGEMRGALGQRIRTLRGIANLQIQPGSFFGDIIDMVGTGLDLAGQAASEAVTRVVFTAARGVILEQMLADYIDRIMAEESTATVYVYGTAGGTAIAGTAVRTSATATAFTLDAGAVVPAAPTTTYAVDISDFSAGTYGGQVFTLTIAGTPVQYFANGADTGITVRDGLVAAVAASPVVPEAEPAGQNPTTLRHTLILTTTGGSYALAVAGPGTAILAYPATSVATTAAITGATYAPAGSLRVGPPLANVVGYTNLVDAAVGRIAETDAQLRARHQVAQRGLGGGNIDAIRAAAMAPVSRGGGGAAFAAVEHNETDSTDAAGNLPHSVRLVIGVADDGQAAANSLWVSKAGGDGTNGPEVFMVTDTANPPANHAVRIDRLVNLWIGVEVSYTTTEDWPTAGDPEVQLEQDIADYIEALQPGEDVRVNTLPIAKFPNGQDRGIGEFEVRVGFSLIQGGPYTFGAYWPTGNPSADDTSVAVSGREKPRAQVIDIIAST